MPRYSPERKEALLKKLLPPYNLSVAEVARQEGISDASLYAWRKPKPEHRTLYMTQQKFRPLTVNLINQKVPG